MKSKPIHFISIVLSVMLLALPAIGASASTGSIRLYYASSGNEALTICEDAVKAYNSAEYASVTDCLAVNIMAFSDKIDISSYNIYASDMEALTSSLLYYHPELININGSYSYSVSESGKIYDFYPTYLFTQDEKDNYYVPYYAQINSIVSQAEKLTDDFSKILFVHDYLALNCEYATEVYSSTYEQDDYTLYNAYGCLVNRHCVCQGYSLAFKTIMDELSIDADYALSNEMTHIWNTVTVGGGTYHIDVTFDDPIEDALGRVSHSNFLCTDAEIGENHYGWTAVQEISENSYEAVFWDNIDSKICFDGDYMYYTEYDGGKYSQLKKRNILTGETQAIPSALDQSLWYSADGKGYYLGGFSRIELLGDTIYYSVPDGVCSIKTDGTEDTRLYTIDSTGERVYGFAVKDGTAYIQTCDVPEESMTAVAIDIELNITEPSVPESTAQNTEPSTQATPDESSTAATPATDPEESSTATMPATDPEESSTATMPATDPEESSTVATPATDPSESSTVATPATDPEESLTAATPATDPEESSTAATPATDPSESSTAATPATDPPESSTATAPVTDPPESSTATAPVTDPPESTTATVPVVTDPTESVVTEPTETDSRTELENLLEDNSRDFDNAPEYWYDYYTKESYDAYFAAKQKAERLLADENTTDKEFENMIVELETARKNLVKTGSTDPNDPLASQPSETDPTKPSSTEPSSTEPSSTEPTSTEPTSTEPSSTKPTSTESTSTEPDEKPIILVGDVNGDGVLDISDVTYIQMYLAGYNSNRIDVNDSVQFATADFNRDNIIDISDATAIQMKLAGYASVN